jgi:hypothetical protein
MDNLSSLKSGLPRASAIRGLADIDTNLITEFKTAANAVTKLFKLSGEKAVVGRNQGYIDAIEDLLDALERDPGMNVLEWALQKQKLFHDGTDEQDGHNSLQGGVQGSSQGSTQYGVQVGSLSQYQAQPQDTNAMQRQDHDQSVMRQSDLSGQPVSSINSEHTNHVASPSPPPIPQNAFIFESSIAYPSSELPEEPRGPFELNLNDPILVEDSHKRKFNYTHRSEKRVRRAD